MSSEGLVRQVGGWHKICTGGLQDRGLVWFGQWGGLIRPIGAVKQLDVKMHIMTYISECDSRGIFQLLRTSSMAQKKQI